MGSPQKVVIPKGLINPNETTIVEIPQELQNVGTVVAKPKGSRVASPVRGGGANARAAHGKTIPPMNKPNWGSFYDGGVTFGGRPNEEPSDASTPCPMYIPNTPPSQRVERYGEMSPGPLPSYKDFVMGRVPNSTMQDIDHVEGSLYRDFRPKGRSLGDTDPHTPPSVRKYQSGEDASTAGGTPNSYAKHSIIKVSNGQISETDITEKSYPISEAPDNLKNMIPGANSSSYYDEGMSPQSGFSSSGPQSGSGSSFPQSSGGGGFTDLSSSCPCTESSNSNSGGYRQFDSSNYSNSPPPASDGSSGGYKRFDSSGGLSPGGSKEVSHSELMDSIGHLEASEMQQIMGDLNSFQAARRRLVFDASSLATPSDISRNALSK